MRITYLLLTLIFLLTCTSAATAGVVVGGTRVIYPEGKNEVSVTLKNTDRNTDYLIQSFLDNADDTNTTRVPFVVTPPLFRLDRESDNVLRIAAAGAAPAVDRETMYWLSVRAIPARSKEQKGNTLQVVVRTRIKFIYRPAALNKNDAAEAFNALIFSENGPDLIVKNPTPYHVTLYSLKVGGKAVSDPGMLTPFGEIRVKAPGRGAIEWQSVNDYGGYSRVARRKTVAHDAE